MTHNDLVNEVTRQLAMRFQPNPLNIKKRIEGLIEVRLLRLDPFFSFDSDSMGNRENTWSVVQIASLTTTWYAVFSRSHLPFLDRLAQHGPLFFILHRRHELEHFSVALRVVVLLLPITSVRTSGSLFLVAQFVTDMERLAFSFLRLPTSKETRMPRDMYCVYPVTDRSRFTGFYRL